MTTGLLIIDIQNDYFAGGKMALSHPEEAAIETKKILDHFRETEQFICYIRHLSNREGAGFLVPGTDGANIHQSIKPRDEELIIEKHFPNSFKETDLLLELRKHHVDQLVIVGMMTHMCVDSTTRAATDLGLKCTVIKDAIATKSLKLDGKEIPAQQVNEAFLAGLNGLFADVVGADDYLASQQ